jgi:hypothetical protein
MVTSRCLPIVTCFLTLIGAAVSAKAAEGVDVSIMPESTAGGLIVSHADLPENNLAYLSCEGVLWGEGQSTPLFEVQLTEAPNDDGAHWIRRADTFAYTWHYDAGIAVAFVARPTATGLHLTYTLTNTGDETRDRVLLHTCVPTTTAPAFFPEFRESDVHEPGKTGNYMGFYGRTWLWRGGEAFSFSETEKGADEIHLSLVRAGQSPVEWGWWVNSPERFDLPVIAVESTDGEWVTGLAFEQADWASCNGGDDRACFHLFPLFGDLQPGKSRTVKGRFYLMPGTRQDLLEQFRRDFPSAGGEEKEG